MTARTGAKPLILRVLSRLAIGGVQNSVIETLACADRERFDFAVLCYKKAGKWAPRVEALDVPVHTQKALPEWDPYQIARLAQAIRRMGPDLVHIYMAPTVIVAASAARLAGVPRIVIHHNSLYADRHWAKRNALLNAWERRLTRDADTLIAVSRPVADCTRAWLGQASGESPGLTGQIEVIPDGVNFERFSNPPAHDLHAELGVNRVRPLVGLVARYLDVKRIEDFIEAARIIGAEDLAPESSKPVFIIIGGGPEEIGSRLKAQARASAAHADIRFLGGRDDLPSLLPSLAVGVLCSEVEGCPNTILEYMCARVPIAATGIASIAEIIEADRDALLSPARDPAALARSVTRLLGEPELRDRLTLAAREKVKAYDWENTERAYEAIYARVLGLEE